MEAVASNKRMDRLQEGHCAQCKGQVAWPATDTQAATQFPLVCGDSYRAACLGQRARATLISRPFLPLRCCLRSVPQDYVRAVLAPAEYGYYKYLVSHPPEDENEEKSSSPALGKRSRVITPHRKAGQRSKSSTSVAGREVRPVKIPDTASFPQLTPASVPSSPSRDPPQRSKSLVSAREKRKDREGVETPAAKKRFSNGPLAMRFLLRFRGEREFGFKVALEGVMWMISSVTPRSAADRAGLRVGDQCAQYLKDRSDDTMAGRDWESNTLRALEDTNPQRCVVIKVRQQAKPTVAHERRNNFAKRNRKSQFFELLLTDHMDVK